MIYNDFGYFISFIMQQTDEVEYWLQINCQILYTEELETAC